MKHLKSISCGIRSVAKLTILFLVLACTVNAADTSPFVSIVGVWDCHMSTGQDRVYTIGEDGSVTFKDSHESNQGKLSVIDGQFAAEFNDRWQVFYKASESVLKIESFNPKSRFEKKEPNATGTGHRATPNPAPNGTSTINLVAPATRTLVLSSTWNTPMQGGTSTMDDLEKLFGTLTTAKAELAGNNGILIYQNIPYLTPVREAVSTLKLDPRMMSKVLIACPGFPRDSLYYYSFDGRFEDGFNRLYLVVDRADQLVAVELVEEAPKTKAFDLVRDNGWHTYNFVLDRTKALNTLKIGHRVAVASQGKWIEPRHNAVFVPDITPQSANWTIARVDSVLAQPDPRNPTWLYNLAAKEVSRWYVPRPLVELILTCVQKPTR